MNYQLETCVACTTCTCIQMNDQLSTEEGGSVADDETTSDQGGAGVVDELDDNLAHSRQLDVT